MDEFKTNICNALMKQSLTSTDNCLNNKRNYNFENSKRSKSLSIRASSLQAENPLTEDLHLAVWHEPQHSNVNQILNLVLQGPTAIGVISWAIGVVNTECIGMIVRRGGI